MGSIKRLRRVAAASCLLSAAAVAAAVAANRDGVAGEAGVPPAQTSTAAQHAQPVARRADGREVVVSHAVWMRPKSLEQLASEADFVGLVRVTAVAAGPPLQLDPRYPKAQLPTRRVTVRVERAVIGDVGREITLYQDGGAVDAKIWKEVEGSPDYVPGRRSVIAARRMPDGSFAPMGPDGRLDVTRNRLRGHFDNGVGGRLAGMSADRALRLIEEAQS